MANQIIDCCSLINLYSGWGSLVQMHTLGFSLHISQAVVDESESVYELGPDGSRIRVPLNLQAMQNELHYTIVRPETDGEINDYVDFAMEIDDGEAQSLAIAKHRGLVLLTDDRRAIAVASRPDVAVQIYTTPQVLQMWGELSAENTQQLPHVLLRIKELARYQPRPNTAERRWWDTHIQSTDDEDLRKGV